MFLNVVDIAFPIKYVKSGSVKKRKPCWYTENLRLLKEQCLMMYDVAKVTGLVYYSELYKMLRSRYRNEVSEAKRTYNCNRVLQASSKSRAIWAVIKENLNVNEKEIINSQVLDLTSGKFNDFFLNNVKEIKQRIPDSRHDMSYYLNKLFCNECIVNLPVFSISNFSVEEVYSAMLSLSNSVSLDVYNINSTILKLAAPYIVEVLTYLFNECINKCEFPVCLKLSKVVPIFKKGVKKEYGNYRPVSIIPVIAKVFEVLLNNKIIKYFEDNLMFSRDQFGFRPKRGTCDAIVSFMKNCVKGLDDKNKVLGCWYDMSKAFDTISHDILLEKLKCYGFDQSALNLLQSYISGRCQTVYYNGCFSSYLALSSGIPQGSILGPTMFIIYINDLTSAFKNVNVKSYMYADDLAVQVHCKVTSLVNFILHDTNFIIEDWTAANSLCLNTSKTQNMEFSLGNNCSHVDNVKFLGVTMQSNVKWNIHIDVVCKKVAKGIFMIRRLRCYVNMDVLKAIYFAHIHSQLSYGIVVWGHSGSVKKLLILQKRAIRTMFSVNSRTHCKPLFRELGILTVTSLYILDCLLYVKTNLDEFPLNNSVHSHFTRYNNLLRVNQCNYQSTIKNFCEFGIRMYNMLPSHIKCLEVKKFKLTVKKCCVSYVLMMLVILWGA
jgi:hypothetical protein